MKTGLLLISLLTGIAVTVSGCTKAPDAPPPVTGGGSSSEEPEQPSEPSDPDEVLVLPEHLPQENYANSFSNDPYLPVSVQYSSSVPVNSWKTAKTRIVPYLVGFDYECTRADYMAATNKYGSRTDMGPYEATGRFQVKKIDGRWYFIDPEGYPHHQRGVASLRKGSSARNDEAFRAKFGNDMTWLEETQEELAKMGFHGSGAFCTDTYQTIQSFNRAHPDTPITLAPSFGFLSGFRKEYGFSYCNGDSNTAIGLVLHDEWPAFCEDFIRTELAPYIGDPNVIGFFSDNEIDFSSMNSRLLDRILKGSKSDVAYQEAEKFMNEKGASAVTEELNDEFAGMLAERYYKGVKEALLKVDKDMLYLGSRLHGTPKYMEHVIRAAGRWCDVISINYYSRWDVELTGAVKDWETWAPDAPFIVTEFYTKGMDTDLNNLSGAGYAVPTQKERAFAYQHFTLGLLEAKNCVGWHWFKYQDDDGDDNSGKPANKGLIDNWYNVYPWMAKYTRDLNYNTYRLMDFF